MKMGEVLDGRLELRELLGEGGMGQVFKTWDHELERFVAIKTLLPQLSSDPSAMAEMKREVRLSQSLNHPNIVAVYDYRIHERTPYIVMEFIDGLPLNRFLHQQPDQVLPEEVFRAFAEQILSGISHAHQMGVVHRDLKPANVMVQNGGRLKIMDFGIAAAIKATYTRLTGHSSGLTIQYSSPEQINGDDPAPTMDIYSLGCLFYEMLRGRPPFYQGEILHQHLTKEPEPIPGVSESLNALVLGCLAKEKTERFQSADELRAILSGKTIRLAPGASRGLRKLAVKDVQPNAGRPLGFPSLLHLIWMTTALIILMTAGTTFWIVRSKRTQDSRRLRASIEASIGTRNWAAAEADVAALIKLTPNDPLALQYQDVIRQAQVDVQVSPPTVPGLANEDRRSSSLKAEIEKDIEKSNWDAADTSIRKLVGEFPNEHNGALSWQRRVKAGRAADLAKADNQKRNRRVTELTDQVSASVVRRNWDDADVALREIAELVPNDGRIATMSALINEGRQADRAAEEQAKARAKDEAERAARDAAQRETEQREAEVKRRRASGKRPASEEATAGKAEARRAASEKAAKQAEASREVTFETSHLHTVGYCVGKITVTSSGFSFSSPKHSISVNKSQVRSSGTCMKKTPAYLPTNLAVCINTSSGNFNFASGQEFSMESAIQKLWGL